MKFTVIAYYTQDTLYEEESLKLKESLEKFHEDYIFFPIKDLSSWRKNTQVKASIIKKALLHLRHSILYVDVDAILQSPLSFYRNNTFPESISAHWIDCKRWKMQTKHSHLFASGTMFFKFTEESLHVIDLWQEYMDRNPGVSDQICLGRVLKDYKIHQMPVEYVTIFDLMSTVENPVFIHNQASRRFN